MLIFRSNRIYAVLVAGLVAALVLTACGEEAKPAPTVAPVAANPTVTVAPATTAAKTTPAATTAAIVIPKAATASSAAPIIVKGKIEETLAEGGYLISVNKVERAKAFTKMTASSPGNTLMALDVTVATAMDRELSLRTTDMYIKDSDGQKYEASPIGKFPFLFGQKPDLSKDEKIRGWVTFEIPEVAYGFVFEFKPLSENFMFRIVLE